MHVSDAGAATPSEPLTRAGLEAIVRRKGAGCVLEILLGHLRRHPQDEGVRQVFNQLLSDVFTQSRQAFAERRLQDAAYLFAVLADYGQPADQLRADLASVLVHLVKDGLEALPAGDSMTARRGARLALALDPACKDALTALAYIERQKGDAEPSLRWTLRILRVEPRTQHAANHLEVAVSRAGKALLQALRDGDNPAAITLAAALRRGDADFSLRLQGLSAASPPRELERELLLWLGTREYDKRSFEDALAYFLQATDIRVGADVLRWEGLARQQLMLEHLRVALRAYCSAYVNDVANGDVQSRDVFHDLDALMVQGLETPNIDHWTRTQYWGSLIGWRSVVDYTQFLGRNPYAPLMNVPYAPPAEARGGERRLFDCCTFFNEAEVLEIRLRELYDVVDGFVVAEAAHTHAGQPKALTFHDHADRFRPYLDKITYVVDEELVGGFSWRREAHQRDALLRGLTGCRDDDIIIVSDVDEIVRRDVALGLRRADPDCQSVFTLEMDLFFYRLNYRFRRDWRSAGAAPFRVVKQVGTNAVRYLALQEIGPLIANAGWHFSWMGDVDRFIAKMTAYAHQEHAAEYAAESQRHIEEMRRFLTEGGPPPACGPGNGMSDYTALAVDDDFPILVREARQHYADMGWLGRLGDGDAPPAPSLEAAR